MSEQPIPTRFHITWRDGRYFVSIPNYDGGEVVRADIADRMAAALEQIETVCLDNAGHNVRHDMALKFVCHVAKQSLSAWKAGL
jgi:enamine deaminase RidA (YjgF/YER057c/UK114 family)